MRIQTWLTERLGVRYPIVQGAFHSFGTSEIAGPVCAAGGLGIITAHCFDTPEALRADIRKVRAMTGNPLGVNFTVFPGRPDIYEAYQSRVEAALDEHVEAIFTSAYDGSPIGRRVQEAGTVWIHKCATMKHALSTAAKGADAIVIVGLEGTGFKNPEQNTTLINITALRRRISIPLIAAGGIGDGRGLAAALAMGACGVYLGTAFMATTECRIPDKWKHAIAAQDISDPGYHRKIFHMQSRDSVVHSMASGTLDSIPTAAGRISSIMNEASEIIQELGARLAEA